jgi:2-dehydro-3-deoxygluconokinase
MKRLGQSELQLAYHTQLGDDHFSKLMLEAWRTEGLNTKLVGRSVRRSVGLTAIAEDDSGKLSSSYWRDKSPARDLFTIPLSLITQSAYESCDLLFFSGITLAILRPEARKKLLSLAESVRARGGVVAFDPNFRSKLWGDEQEMFLAYASALEVTDCLLTSVGEQRLIFGDETEGEIADRFLRVGLGEAVVRAGAAPIKLWDGEVWSYEASPVVEHVVDSSGAGDGFNAAYLLARLFDMTPTEAVRAGNQLSAEIVKYRGAVIDPDDLPRNLMWTFRDA